VRAENPSEPVGNGGAGGFARQRKQVKLSWFQSGNRSLTPPTRERLGRDAALVADTVLTDMGYPTVRRGGNAVGPFQFPPVRKNSARLEASIVSASDQT
jgi:hypothetical protein